MTDEHSVNGNRLDPWLDDYATPDHGLRVPETRSLLAVAPRPRCAPLACRTAHPTALAPHRAAASTRPIIP